MKNFHLLLIFCTVLLLCYIAIYYVNKTSDQKIKQSQIDYLLKNGIPLKIDLINSIISIKEKQTSNQTNFQDFINLFVPFYVIKNALFYNPKNIVTFIKLKYQVNGIQYDKEITLPYTVESVMIYFKMRESTILYYEEAYPENSLIDLNFIE